MLEYQTQVDAISQTTGKLCPPKNAKVRSITAWRWVFNPLSEKCFQPVAIRNPPRLARANQPSEQCSCWGLSMHVTEEDSIAAFHALEENFDRARKLIGTHIAVGTLSAAHGVATPADTYGHFDLHPKVSAPFHKTFVVQPNPIPELPDE